MTPRFKERIVVWQTMIDTLAPKLTDMPQFTADHTALTAVVAQARDLEMKQDLAVAQLRDINSQRDGMIKNGADLRDRLARGLQSVLGPKNVNLLQFGVKPRPAVIHRKRSTKAELAARKAAAAEILASPAPPASAVPAVQPGANPPGKP